MYITYPIFYRPHMHIVLPVTDEDSRLIGGSDFSQPGTGSYSAVLNKARW